MQWGTLWRVLGLCLLSVGAWGQEENEETGSSALRPYKVSISGTTVTVKCPLDTEHDINWEKNNEELKDYKNQEDLILDNFSEMENSGSYSCYTGNKEDMSHYLYLRARVCENCMEVDVMAVATIVIVDICITLGLMMFVYYWSKNKKAKAKPVTRGMGAGGRPRGQNKERPPPVPNPDYEPIRKGQRDLYSGLNQRGI
nr:CD3e molecule, epsilon (CD3-TCR complex) [Galago senegalensis]